MNFPLMDVARRAQPGIAAPGAGLSSRWKPDGSGLEPGNSGGHRIVSKLSETVSVLDFISPALHGGIVLGANTVDLKPCRDQAFALSGCFVRVPRGRYLSRAWRSPLRRHHRRWGKITRPCKRCRAGATFLPLGPCATCFAISARWGTASRARSACTWATRLPTRRVRGPAYLRLHWRGPAMACREADRIAVDGDARRLHCVGICICASVKVERYGMEDDVNARPTAKSLLNSCAPIRNREWTC